MKEPLWRKVWWFLIKLSVPQLRYLSKINYMSTQITCANVHSKFVFIIAKHQKRHQIPSTKEWRNCGKYIQWYPTQQWKVMNTEIFNKMDRSKALCETQKFIYHMIPCIWCLRKAKSTRMKTRLITARGWSRKRRATAKGLVDIFRAMGCFRFGFW